MILPPPSVIRITNLSKVYRIWRSPGARLSAVLWQCGAGLPLIGKFCRAQRARLFREFNALSNINFEVFKGESMGIIGRNGSGKSTLLQMLAGTLSATSGQTQVTGRIAALLELGSGFNPEFTGRENVMLNGSILGLSQQEVLDRFDDIATFADIGDFIDQPVRTYSSGMTLRLAFSVMAHVDAEILIIDEALAVGDVFFVQKCMRWLREFRKTGTLLFVTHNAADLTSLCDRAVWLRDGNLERIGSAKEVSQAYLEYFHTTTSGAGSAEAQPSRAAADVEAHLPKINAPVVDQRLQWLNTTPYRNDITPLVFDPTAEGYGGRAVAITHVEFRDSTTGGPLVSIVGGERVTLCITVHAHNNAENVIVGFYLKDRLGQYLFGDNTYLSFIDSPVSLPAGATACAKFGFQMPLLPHGKYTVSPAVAIGSQDAHQQQHWIHDALVLESTNKVDHRGLIAIPMESVSLSILEP